MILRFQDDGEDITRYVQELKVSYWCIGLRYYSIQCWIEGCGHYESEGYEDEHFVHEYVALFVPAPAKLPTKYPRLHPVADKVAWHAVVAKRILRAELACVDYVIAVSKDEATGKEKQTLNKWVVEGTEYYEPDGRLAMLA